MKTALYWSQALGVLAVAACAPNAAPPASGAPPRAQDAPAPTRVQRIVVEGPAPENAACQVVPIGRGCSTVRFEGVCAQYLSANADERAALQADRYLNLRFAKDHRPFVGPPPVLPHAAHRAFVASGVAIDSIMMLVEILSGKAAQSYQWPSEDVVKAVAFSDDYAGSAWQLTDDALRRLAQVKDLRAVSAAWDRKARAAEPKIAFHANAADECLGLLTHIVDVARDAQASGRSMYFVQSLARYEPKCTALGGCGGYGCDGPQAWDSDTPTFCHSERDECLQGLDCQTVLACAYRQAEQRFVCRQAIPDGAK